MIKIAFDGWMKQVPNQNFLDRGDIAHRAPRPSSYILLLYLASFLLGGVVRCFHRKLNWELFELVPSVVPINRENYSSPSISIECLLTIRRC